MEIILLFFAGILAGAINSLAGGGSFILFPALLLAGVPPIMANATNTFASMPGYVSGTFGFWRDIKQYKAKLIPYIIAAIIGGFLGAELLLRVSNEQFSVIVPYLMAMAVFLFAFGDKIYFYLATKNKGGDRGKQGGVNNQILTALLLFILTLICLYGGFFNAGLGIILLAFFALAGMKNIHAMNGLKLLLSAIVSLIAVVCFAISDSIAWQEGIIAFVGTLIGGYLAAKWAHFIPTKILRNLIIIYGVILIPIFFWRAYMS